MYKYLLLLLILITMACNSSPPVVAPYTAPPAQRKSVESRQIEGAGWSIILPAQFKLQPRNEMRSFEMVALDKESESLVFIYIEDFNGSLDDLVSGEAQDAMMNDLKIVKIEPTTWPSSNNARYMEILNQDNTRTSKFWFAVKGRKALSFSCILPRPTNDDLIGLCQDMAHSFKWNN